MDQPLAELKVLKVTVRKRPATDTKPTFLVVSLPSMGFIGVAYDYAANDPMIAAVQDAVADVHGVIIEPRDVVYVHAAGNSVFYDVTIPAAQMRERATA
jgi:hypothetical protein